MTKLKDLKKRLMMDPDFREEYARANEEYVLVEALVRARTTAKLTQSELARRLGTTQSSVARLEGGRVSPSFATLRRYAKATGTRLKVSFERDAELGNAPETEQPAQSLNVDRLATEEITSREVLLLDSSTFIQEAGLTSRGASALKHYLYHRGTKLVVPEVVAEECQRKLTAIAKKRTENVRDTLTWLGRFHGKVSGWTGPDDEASDERAKALAKAAHLQAVVLPETGPVRARAEARHRAERPPSHRSSELADCRIWEQCLQLLSRHDVVFVSADRDFCSRASSDELHPQLQAEAEAVGAGRTLTFHPKMESLLCDLKREVPTIQKDQILAFVYNAAAADVKELEANSGYRPKRVGHVRQTFLTTDQADVIEVRLEVEDKWENDEDGLVADFFLNASCRYRLTDQQLHDMTVSNLRLMALQPDGSVRAVKGSYVVAFPGALYLGETPIRPEPEVLG